MVRLTPFSLRRKIQGLLPLPITKCWKTSWKSYCFWHLSLESYQKSQAISLCWWSHQFFPSYHLCSLYSSYQCQSWWNWLSCQSPNQFEWCHSLMMKGWGQWIVWAWRSQDEWFLCAQKHLSHFAQLVLVVLVLASSDIIQWTAKQALVTQIRQKFSCLAKTDNIHKTSRVDYIISDLAVNLSEALYADLHYFISCQGILKTIL